MEEEFIRNQERLKPQEEKIEEERSKVTCFVLPLVDTMLINICIYLISSCLMILSS